MSLVANFAGKAARSLGNKFSERAAIPANASTDGEVFEQDGLDSATRLAALENKVDGVGVVSTNRQVATLAERMGRDPRAEEEKRKDEEFRARILRNASEEFRERLAERMAGLRREIERLTWEMDRFQEILDKIEAHSFAGLDSEDHEFLQETEPDLYRRWMDYAHKEQTAIQKGRPEEAKEYQKKAIGEAIEQRDSRQEKIEKRQELEKLYNDIYDDAAKEELLAIESGQFKNPTLREATEKSGMTAETLAQDPDQLADIISKMTDDVSTELATEGPKAQIVAAVMPNTL